MELQVIEKAVEAAEEYQAQLEHNKEGVKMMQIVAQFLRKRKRLLYGGYAINALLPDKDKFYDPKKELPDFDFLTPDPLTDVAELIQIFIQAGYQDVEPAIGIHEGTYKVFVNYQGVADITLCDPTIYATLQKEAVVVDSLHVCSPDYLRMNMFHELSHPAGDITRWAKVYKRLLLLNKARPLKDGCKLNNKHSVSEQSLTSIQKSKLYSRYIHMVAETKEIVLGIPDMEHIFRRPTQAAKNRFKTLKRMAAKVPLLALSLSTNPVESAKALITSWSEVAEGFTYREIPKLGELIPERVEILYEKTEVVAVFFHTVACHAYYEVPVGQKVIHVGSIDTLLNFYYAFYYGEVPYINGQYAILCICQNLLNLAEDVRVKGTKPWPFPPISVKCLGYQPTLAELKKEHRERVKNERKKKKAEIAFRRSIRTKLSSNQTPKTKKTRKRSKTSKKSKTT
jgi:hypothetical protein